MDIIKDYIISNPIKKVFCHIDCIVVYLLENDEGLCLIDWEYFGMLDPCMDLAMNVLYSYLDPQEPDNLLEIFLVNQQRNLNLNATMHLSYRNAISVVDLI